MSDDSTSKSTSVWSDRYTSGDGTASKKSGGNPIDYASHPFIWRESIVKALTGRLDGDPNLELARRIFEKPAEKMLALGSGLATVEEWYVTCGFVDKCIAYEMSPVAVDIARERIASKGLAHRLEMVCGDVLKAQIEENCFDVVFVHAAIHHFFEIEAMYRLMHRALKPGGLLIFNEYVGPDYLLFDKSTLDMMDEIDACLDDRYRFNQITGKQRLGVDRLTLEQALAMDPSEGVHASQILPLTYQYFDIVERTDFGGTILRPFFTGILNNFDLEDPRDQTIIRLIVLMETLLTRNSIIQHSQTRIVARRRENPRAPLTDAQKARICFEDWAGLDD